MVPSTFPNGLRPNAWCMQRRSGGEDHPQQIQPSSSTSKDGDKFTVLPLPVTSYMWISHRRWRNNKNNGIESYIFVAMAHPIVVSCVACCVPLRLVVGDLHGETRNNDANSKVGIVSVHHPKLVLMLLCSTTPLKPFEACCSCVGSINQTLEDFTKWPVKCGNAIKNCSSACPSP